MFNDFCYLKLTTLELNVLMIHDNCTYINWMHLYLASSLDVYNLSVKGTAVGIIHLLSGSPTQPKKNEMKVYYDLFQILT
jgi:hypothetical protein